MPIYWQTLDAIAVLGVLIGGTAWLRSRGILYGRDAGMFADLITRVSVPAVIFHALSHATLSWTYLTMTGVLFAAEAVLFLLALAAVRLLKLERAQTGSFILAAVFGSSALLGYALVAELFPDRAGAMAEAAIVSELGVGVPLFTAGVMIAIYYGRERGAEGHLLRSAAAFFRSPIFLAIVGGGAWSFAGLPVEGRLLSPFFQGVGIVASANTFLVVLLVGVTLRADGVRTVLPVVAAAALLKLLLLPLGAALASRTLGAESWQTEVLLIEAAMPSAMLGVAFARQYGCDTALASKLAFATLLLSALTLSMMTFVFY